MFCKNNLRRKLYELAKMNPDLEEASLYRTLNEDHFIGGLQTLSFLQLQACTPYTKCSSVTKKFYCIINTSDEETQTGLIE